MQSYQEIIAEQERQRREKAERDQALARWKAERDRELEQQSRDASVAALQRIAVAAEARADQAIQDAKDAKKEARFSKVVSIISIVIALASVLVPIVFR